MNKRMHKSLALLLALWLGANITAVFAQQNMSVWTIAGTPTTLPTSQVDSLTFTAKNAFSDLSFTVTEESLTENGFEATASALLSPWVKSFHTPVMGKSFDITTMVGVCYSAVNSLPTVGDLKRKLGTNCDTYRLAVGSLLPGTTYYFRPYITLLDETCYGPVVTVTTKGTKTADRSRTVNGHRFVDLGLASGLLWAETNVGAESAAQAGSYFAWGETQTKTSYTADNAAWYGTEHTGNLTAAEDAATALWGEGVRTPTYAEMTDLMQNCVWTWTALDGTKGYRVSSATNGNSVFLPVTGRYSGETLDNLTLGNYWTSSPTNEFHAYKLKFIGGLRQLIDGESYFGHTVRPVVNAD